VNLETLLGDLKKLVTFLASNSSNAAAAQHQAGAQGPDLGQLVDQIAKDILSLAGSSLLTGGKNSAAGGQEHDQTGGKNHQVFGSSKPDVSLADNKNNWHRQD